MIYPVLGLTPSDIVRAMKAHSLMLRSEDMDAIVEHVFDIVWACIREDYWDWVREATEAVLEERDEQIL